MNVSQMHYARKGIVTPEMEFIAIRENLQREQYIESLKATGKTGGKMLELLMKQHRASRFGAAIPDLITPEFVRERSGARPRHHSRPTSTTRNPSR